MPNSVAADTLTLPAHYLLGKPPPLIPSVWPGAAFKGRAPSVCTSAPATAPRQTGVAQPLPALVTPADAEKT